MLNTTVLVVGAGPVGMWLALELRRADIDVLIIDMKTSRDARDGFSKALTLSAGTLETFHSRALSSTLLEQSVRLPRAHFGAIDTWLELNSEVLGVVHSYNLAIPQARTEAILLGLYEKAGVRFAWGSKFHRFAESPRGVVVTAGRISPGNDGGNETVDISARWLVGCDGTHSTVRASAEIPFEGLPHSVSGILADLILTEVPSGGESPMVICPVGSNDTTIQAEFRRL